MTKKRNDDGTPYPLQKYVGSGVVKQTDSLLEITLEILSRSVSRQGAALQSFGKERVFVSVGIDPLSFYEDYIFSPDGSLFAITEDLDIAISDTISGGKIAQLHSNSYAAALAFTPDGSFIASGHGNGNINIWSISTGRLTSTLKGHPEVVDFLDFSLDGRFLISCTTNLDGEFFPIIKVWDIETGEDFRDIEVTWEHVDFIAISHDNRWVATLENSK